MAAAGTYVNPSDKRCWHTCSACLRCEDKGMWAKCQNCSGRHDPFGITDPDIDDKCRCTEGILQFVTFKREFKQVKYKSNPFTGQIITKPKTEDERDWESYLQSMRDKLESPDWDPIIGDFREGDWG
jgi:hypothetical protein